MLEYGTTSGMITEQLYGLPTKLPNYNAIGVFNATEELGLMVLDTTGKEYWSADIGTYPFQQGFDCFKSNNFHLLLHHS